jgi:hypothetical protein
MPQMFIRCILDATNVYFTPLFAITHNCRIKQVLNDCAWHRIQSDLSEGSDFNQIALYLKYIRWEISDRSHGW